MSTKEMFENEIAYLKDELNKLYTENQRLKEVEEDHKQVNRMLLKKLSNLEQNINKVINDINRYLEARKIINDNTKYYYTNEFYKRPIKSNIAYLFNDYLQYLIYLLEGDNHDPN